MIKVCDNEEEIRSIVIDDQEMFERVSFDGIDKDNKLINKGIWLKWLSGNTIEALCFIKTESAFIIDIHIHVPKQFRGKGTLNKGRDFLRWVVENANGRYIKIQTKIPTIHRDVILFAMKLGFKREGTSKKSFIKKGKVLDVAYMGITFEEVY